jgi:hypothetical protein
MARKTEHSKMGIWSLGLSLFFGAGFLLSFAGLWFMRSAGYFEGADIPGLAVLLVLVIPVCLFFVVVAMGLGIAGILQRRRRRLFAVLGTFFSVLILVVAYYTLLAPLLESFGYSLPLT